MDDKADGLDTLKLRKPTGNELELGLDPDPYYLRGWNDCIDRLAQHGMINSGWLPIESAPRDGTYVDLWVTGRTIDGTGSFRMTNCWYNNGKWHSRTSANLDEITNGIKSTPTHWRPLPATPKGNSNDKK